MQSLGILLVYRKTLQHDVCTDACVGGCERFLCVCECVCLCLGLVLRTYLWSGVVGGGVNRSGSTV